MKKPRIVVFRDKIIVYVEEQNDYLESFNYVFQTFYTKKIAENFDLDTAKEIIAIIKHFKLKRNYITFFADNYDVLLEAIGEKIILKEDYTSPIGLYRNPNPERGKIFEEKIKQVFVTE